MKWLGNLFGGKQMQALAAGTHAPQFELPAMDGSKFSLAEALSRGPVLAVFFKVSCPVCQYAFPYYERIYNAYISERLSIIGISQNDKQDTGEFMKKFGISFSVLLDDTKLYPVSNAYGLTNVPSAFWISQDGQIEISSVGWVRNEFEEMARQAATATEVPAKPLFKSSEQVADFRAG